MPGPAAPLVVLAASAVLFVGLVGAGRLLATATRPPARLLARVLPGTVAGVLAALLVALVVGAVLDRVVWRGLLSAADQTFRLADDATPDGAVRPSSPLRSGGPG